jgi:hypothetical protein
MNFMQNELGDDYRLFMLDDAEGKPTVVILPRDSANEGSISRLTEVIKNLYEVNFNASLTTTRNYPQYIHTCSFYSSHVVRWPSLCYSFNIFRPSNLYYLFHDYL